jgi:hypothetical protein
LDQLAESAGGGCHEYGRHRHDREQPAETELTGTEPTKLLCRAGVLRHGGPLLYGYRAPGRCLILETVTQMMIISLAATLALVKADRD